MCSQILDQDYFLRCSEKTLQTNNKGFFLQFADHAAEAAGSKWIKNVFGKLENDGERIRIIYQYKPIKEVVCETLSHVQEIYRKKNAEVSQKRRKEVEKIITKETDPKALILACQSVLRAPPTGENHKIDDGFTLSLAYWTRATVLMDLRKYSLALLDLQAAVKEGLSEELKTEAYFKMGVCYKGKGEVNKANISFSLTEKLLEGDLKKLQKIKEGRLGNFEEVHEIDRRVCPSVSGGINAKLPNASRKITVKSEMGQGRFAVAYEEIKTGDTIVVEEPIAGCLLPDCYATHCHHCFDRLVSPVGCSDCASIAFCKAECRDHALKTYHRYECHFLDLLIGSGMSILCHTALRMITQNTLNETLMKYSEPRSFCTNVHLRPAEDFLQRTLMAAFLLRCLQKSNYFIDGQANEDVIPDDDELKVGELLLYYLQMLQFNAHEVYETRHEPEHRFRTAKTGYIGVALYPTVALFNHDCYPAVTRHFVGKKIVITAVRPLSVDDVVAENYGPVFTRKPLVSRQKTLSARYWFECKCEACQQDWPSYENGLKDISQRLRCPNSKCSNVFTANLTKEKLTCPKCKKNVSLGDSFNELKEVENRYQAANEAFDSEQPEKAIEILCQAIDRYHKISKPPHCATQVAQEVLRACLADFGNVYEHFVKKS